MNNENELGKSGKRPTGWFYLLGISILMVVLVAAYIDAHFLWPASTTARDPYELVHLDELGHATVMSVTDINWTVGASEAKPHLDEIDKQNGLVDKLREALPEQLSSVCTIFASSGVNCDTLRTVICTNQNITPCNPAEMQHASIEKADPGAIVLPVLIGNIEYLRLRYNARPGTNTAPVSAVNPTAEEANKTLSETLTSLHKLQDLRNKQKQHIMALKTPYGYTLFWMNPFGLFAEALFWSLFGLISSLIYNMSEYMRKDTFDAKEEYVCSAKFFYAPIVTIVFVMMIWNGVIDGVEPSTRTWSIPLLGFLIGMNCRKAIEVVDGVSELVLRTFTKKILTAFGAEKKEDDDKEGKSKSPKPNAVDKSVDSGKAATPTVTAPTKTEPGTAAPQA